MTASPASADGSRVRSSRSAAWSNDASRGRSGWLLRTSRSLSVESTRSLTSGTAMIERRPSADTSSSCVGWVATTSAVRALPVRAAISPKKSPAVIVDRPR